MVMALSQETGHWWRVIIVYSTNGFSRFIRALCTLLHSHYNDFFLKKKWPQHMATAIQWFIFMIFDEWFLI